MKALRLFIFMAFLLQVSDFYSQNIKKGYNLLIEGLNMKNQTEQAELFLKSISIFDKAVLKDTTNSAAYLGLSVIYSVDNYTHNDYFKAWNNFQKSEKYKDNLTETEIEILTLYFAAQDIRRRNKKIEKNIKIEEELLEDKLIRYVREENNLKIAKRFITEYPDSRYLKNVVHIRNYLEFRKAEKENNIAEFRNFIKIYPEAAQVDLAKKYIEQLIYEKVKNSSNIDDLTQFITDFPDSEFNYLATKFRNHLAFNKSRLENTVKAYDEFIQNYSKAIQLTEAKQLKMKLVFEKAKSINTIEAYNKFVEMYPEGEHYIDIFNLKANVLGENIKSKNKSDFNGINWIKSFDNKGFRDAVYDIIIDENNEILILGTTKISKEGSDDLWFLKLTETGKMSWNRSMGDSLNEKLVAMDLMDNNHFVAVGKNKFNDTIKGNAWIVGAQLDGSNAWNKNLEASNLKAVKMLTEKEFIVGGSYFTEDNTYKFYVAKIRTDGKTIWQRNYVIHGEVNEIAISDSNDVVFCGTNYIVMLDESGYVTWEKAFSDSVLIEKVLLNSNIMYYSEKLNNSNINIIKSDFKGKMIWTKTISGKNIYVCDLIQTPDNKLLMSVIENNDVKLFTFSAEGEIIKKETFGTDKKEINCVLKMTSSNSLIMAITIDYREGDSDILVINKNLGE